MLDYKCHLGWFLYFLCYAKLLAAVDFFDLELKNNDFVFPSAFTYCNNTGLLSCELTPENIKKPLCEVLYFIGSHEDLRRLDKLCIKDLPLDDLSLQKFFLFSDMSVLILSNNNLAVFPLIISELTSLKVLGITHNSLNEVPAQISQLSKLRHLYLSQNNISIIASQIGELAKLRSLHLDDNQLKSLPKEFKKINRLAYLTLHDNQFDPKESWGDCISDGCTVRIEKYRGFIFLSKPLSDNATEQEKFKHDYLIKALKEGIQDYSIKSFRYDRFNKCISCD